MNHYLKTTALIVVLGTMTIFSKTIQHTVIQNYNECAAFISDNTLSSINPLGV